MVIGGADIFAQALSLVARLLASICRRDGDVILPPIDIAAWRDTVRRDVPPNHTVRLAFTLVGHCAVMMRRRVR
jgi:hypothetical protein